MSGTSLGMRSSVSKTRHPNNPTLSNSAVWGTLLSSELRGQNEAETVVAEPAAGGVDAPIRSSAAPRTAEPAATPQNAVGARGRTTGIRRGRVLVIITRVPIGTPLPDIPAHIHEAKRALSGGAG